MPRASIRPLATALAPRVAWDKQLMPEASDPVPAALSDTAHTRKMVSPTQEELEIPPAWSARTAWTEAAGGSCPSGRGLQACLGARGDEDAEHVLSVLMFLCISPLPSFGPLACQPNS